ncbi:MAG: hypothetical protein SNJ72_04900 [Fimbriimonadales bacterium]
MSEIQIRTAGAVDDWNLLRATTPKGEPLPLPFSDLATTIAQLEYPGTPIGFAYPFRLPGVGRIYLWTNGAKAQGYSTRSAPSELEAEFLRNRLERVSQLIRQYARRGVPLEEAQTLLQQAQATAGTSGSHDSDTFLNALSLAVQAGEQAVVAIASTRLQRMGGREIFLWSASMESPTELTELFAPLNMVALSMDNPDTDWRTIIQTLARERIALKAEHLINDSDIAEARGIFEASLPRRLQTSIDAYRGQIRYWNLFTDLAHFSAQAVPTPRAIETVRHACEVARQMDFGMVRLLGLSNSLYHRTGAFQLLDACVEHGVPFECIQLNLCWCDYDLFDLDALLETVGDWGKPIHLSLSLPTETGDLPLYREQSVDWFAGAYLIALSKPYVVALQVPLVTSERSAGLFQADGTLSPYGERLRTSH